MTCNTHKYHFALLAIAVFLSACNMPAPSQNQTPKASPNAIFDDFSYQGKDTIFNQPLAKTKIQNPILNGFYPDPSIVRVGHDYYMVNSTFSLFPGLPIFHSKDLAHWQQLGNAINRPEQLNFDGLHIGYNGIYAPAIEYRQGTFYIITTCVGCGGNFIITATDPAGPWSDPIWLPELAGIDPSLFFDDDGKVYIVHHKDPANKKYPAHTSIAIMEVDANTFQPISKDVELVNGDDPAPWHTEYLEGPHIYKVKNKYYLSASGGGTEYFHSYLLYRADSILGPYEANQENPVLTQIGLPKDREFPITAAGHGDLFDDPNGDWWVVFLANRVYDLDKTDIGHFHTGREPFLLPVTWNDGWPTILPDHAPIPYQIDRPALPQIPSNNEFKRGNYTQIYDFESNQVPLEWLFIRTPRTQWWKIENGRLFMSARKDRLGENNQPSFIGRRLAHMKATYSVKLQFPELQPGLEAGMMSMQNDDNYIAFGLSQNSQGDKVLQVRRKANTPELVQGVTIKEQRITLQRAQQIELRVDIDKANMDFYYRIEEQPYQPLIMSVNSSVLSSFEAGGFTGAIVGMYSQDNNR